MFSEPDDPGQRTRMRSALVHAATAFDVTPLPDAKEAWGHGGRTIGAPAATSSGRFWLRVLEAPEGKQGGKLWTGTAEADTALPAGVPRPHLLRSADWSRDAHAYRAELTSYITTPVCSESPALSHPVALPDTWWSDLRKALDTVSASPMPSGRSPVITQDYVDRTIPRYLTTGIDTHVHRWAPAHGDLHWANLTGPQLHILDWEGFGPAPYGFDAAHLHAYTLLVPDLAAHTRNLFADILNTVEGRLAELTVAAMILQAADRDPVHAHLAPHVRDHAQRRLDSPPCNRARDSG